MMPLTMVEEGAVVKLSRVNGGHGLRKRLADLGLTPGTLLHIVRSDAQGSLIVALKDDARLALGRGMAHRIVVQPEG